MKTETTFTITPQHAALPGHFPGNPIVPGVVLLDELAHAIKAAHPAIQLSGISSVKFLSPLLPGEPCDITLAQGRNHSIKFECRSGERVIASGSFTHAPSEVPAA